jgi:hypothetical protein
MLICLILNSHNGKIVPEKVKNGNLNQRKYDILPWFLDIDISSLLLNSSITFLLLIQKYVCLLELERLNFKN